MAEGLFGSDSSLSLLVEVLLKISSSLSLLIDKESLLVELLFQDLDSLVGFLVCWRVGYYGSGLGGCWLSSCWSRLQCCRSP